MMESAMHRMKVEGEDPNPFGPSNRRREARMPLTFPIEVSGFDRRGHFFTEQSSCSDVGEVSCAFRLHADVEEDAVLAIRSFHWQNNNVLDTRPVLFQVARIESEKDNENERECDSTNESATGARIIAAVRLQPDQPQNSQEMDAGERAVS